MVRWQPDARGRLEQAAMELYVERGFDETTVAAIADRAELTERTFFRHFTDKREVLFGGAGALQEVFVTTLLAAPAATAPIDAVAAAVGAAATAMGENRGMARQRQRVIEANATLQERELIKLATLGAAIAAALRTRGVADLAASLAAEAGIAVFRITFARWITGTDEHAFPDLVHEAFAELKAVTAG